MYKRKLFTALFFSMLVAGCHNSSSTKTTALSKGELLYEINAEDMRERLLSQGLPIEEYNVYGYKAYKIPYVTKDEKNKEINVSGLLVIPTELPPELTEGGLSIVSSLHGTITLNENAPTEYVKKYKELDSDSIIFSSLGGFATLQPDYIGYGDSRTETHPYSMKKSLAESTIDLIDATKIFAKANGIELNEKLFITGYSEGGYGAMATVQKLEEMGRKVVASAPMAGGYDLNYIAKSSLGLEKENLTGFSSAYFALTSLAYTEVYNKNISTLINVPYDSQIKTLLDGEHTFEQIEKALPQNSYGKNGLFRTDFINDYRTNSQNWFNKALKENSVYDWSPKSPMHIVHCQGDDQVPYAIAQKTYETMLNNGAVEVELITPDENEPLNKKWNHEECGFSATVHTAFWFVEMRDR
jgi:pimeloyl-ACP methyl ester carboxylesterase